MATKMKLKFKATVALENLDEAQRNLVDRVVMLLTDPRDDQVRRLFFAGKLALRMRRDGKMMFIPTEMPGFPRQGAHNN